MGTNNTTTTTTKQQQGQDLAGAKQCRTGRRQLWAQLKQYVASHPAHATKVLTAALGQAQGVAQAQRLAQAQAQVQALQQQAQALLAAGDLQGASKLLQQAQGLLVTVQRGTTTVAQATGNLPARRAAYTVADVVGAMQPGVGYTTPQVHALFGGTNGVVGYTAAGRPRWACPNAAVLLKLALAQGLVSCQHGNPNVWQRT